jgi:hypothetical protein
MAQRDVQVSGLKRTAGQAELQSLAPGKVGDLGGRPGIGKRRPEEPIGERPCLPSKSIVTPSHPPYRKSRRSILDLIECQPGLLERRSEQVVQGEFP